MRVIEETAIADAVLPLTGLKEFLRLGTGFGSENMQDTMLKAFLRAAIAGIETRTGKLLLTRVFRLEIGMWRDGLCEVLPLSPVQEILSVDLNGTSPTGLYVQTGRDGRDCLLASGALPSLGIGQQLILRCEAGLADSWGDVPADLAQAVLMLAAHYYEYRADPGLEGGCVPFGVSALLEAHRPLRLGVGV